MLLEVRLGAALVGGAVLFRGGGARVTLAPMLRTRPERRFGDGLLASVPIALAYFPVAVSFGVAAGKGGFSLAEAAFMSLVIYAGASQFLALALLIGGASPILTILSLLAMNARHLLYAPALLKSLGGRGSVRHAWLWSFGLTDEVFASALGRVANPEHPWSERWQAGIGLGAYAAWVSGTVVGAALGGGAFERFPYVDAALGFLLPALFLSLLLAMFERRHTTAVAAAALGFWLGDLPFATTASGILVGMLTGGVAGVFAARGREGQR